MFADLVRKNRSYRRFDESHAVSMEVLRELVALARFSPSGGNIQPLKYFLSCEPAENAGIFPHTRWAGYLKDWDGPTEGERPSAYIVVLGDKEISSGAGCDHGIAAQSMLLGAVEKGLGGCMIGSIDRPQLGKALNLPDHYEILLIIALGKPAETVILEDATLDCGIKYYRDDQDRHHVPKRPLDELILEL
jgi:nitroreductase